MSMDQVVDNLWIGDLPSALDTAKLREHKIHSVLSAMRGRVSINETFMRLQINLDDTEDADVLEHILSAVTFIQAELEKGRGVLVHCQAGISRSATLVAAYLMYSRDIDVDSALELIRKARPVVQPNDGFLRQLQIFHKAKFRVSPRDKETRMFYLERVIQEVMNGDGTFETDMFAKYPRTPSDSVPPTPGGPRRRIRCKMCRQELATREHMLDHGQLGPPTPASFYASPAVSRRPSTHERTTTGPTPPASRRPSAHDGRPSLSMFSPLTSISPSGSRRPSVHEPTTRPRLDSISETRPVKSSLLALGNAAQLGEDLSDALDESALENESSDDESSSKTDVKLEAPKAGSNDGAPVLQDKPQTSLDRPLPTSPTSPTSISAIPPKIVRRLSSSARGYSHPTDLAAQLYANPKLAALRLPSSPTVNTSTSTPTPTSMSMTSITPRAQTSPPPILANPKCSGYFVEPMKWMEPFLEEGRLEGKIICPNKKCGAKLGNYDWAGVCCSCKEWVVPGFCISRSKVDEVV